MNDVVLSILVSILAAAAVMAVTALVARRQGRVAVVDVGWGAAFVAATLCCALVATTTGAGDAARTWLLAAILVVWGLRLTWHIARRSAGHREEDPRYVKLLGGTLAEVGMGVAVRKVFALQGAVVAVIALPVSVGVVADDVWWPVVVAGVVVWAVGIVFEAVGDAQLAAYRAQPRATRPPVLDTGLWRWTRHPNYFGDACVWWGVWLVGGLASGWVVGVATIVAPIAMTYFLAFATGARLLERTMMQRPGYPEYAARTSGFVPWPPRGPRGSSATLHHPAPARSRDGL